MLDKNNKRMLAYTIRVGHIDEIPGADNIALAHANAWPVIVKKNEFAEDDMAVFFEIDSKMPEDEERYAFLAAKHYKIKTMKLGKFGVFSQGLLMPLSEFPEIAADTPEFTDVTDILHITYAVPEDNQRKSNNMSPDAKLASMKARHKKVFSNPYVKKMMKYKWFRKLMLLIFGKKRLEPKDFPTKFEFIHKTDEERVENMPWILEDKEPWIKTTKIDGTSSTYILEKKGRKYEKYVCSRNVRQLTPSQKNFHTEIEGNVYWMMADKYSIFDFLKVYLESGNYDYVCLQGETAGPSLQGNPHKFKDLCFFGFNLINSKDGRVNSVEAAKLCQDWGNIPWVPIVDTNYILPDDMEEFKLSADGLCEAPGASGNREGYVYRSFDGTKSFKNVSRVYLAKQKD